MEYQFYLVNETRLLCDKDKEAFELINGKWSKVDYQEISDRLMGYDPSEKDGMYGIGDSDIMSEIKKITKEQAIEIAGLEAINSL